MPTCRFCGAEMAEDDKFCLKCGAPNLKEGEEIEPLVIDAPEGAEVIIWDSEPEDKK